MNFVFSLVTLVVLWTASFCIELATRLWISAYMQFGADLPDPTRLMVGAVRSYLPWIFAAVLSVMVISLAWRKSPCLPLVSTGLSATVAVLVSLALLASALPLMKCGWSWPGWSPGATSCVH